MIKTRDLQAGVDLPRLPISYDVRRDTYKKDSNTAYRIIDMKKNGSEGSQTFHNPNEEPESPNQLSTTTHDGGPIE